MALIVGTYLRNIRQRGNGLEAVEITWPPGTRTKKHDHGRSIGLIWVLKGSIFEVRNGKLRHYRAGQRILEVPPGFAHIVGNDSNEEAITFHVFTPELEMNFFKDALSDTKALDQVLA